ncbi:PIR Superfamily Protein [Plasmodium ovale curtisi]|uniref:PIR Superfamily Protein n=1 Tax=Plasmodium ovale curtisi TaxID=864141 RepID=A0A1A8X5U1_PLAOA|nr:PIR Superfamily Protein [Plasmodium ovale curtisi]
MKMLILRFFDTLNTNKDLKKYYDKIESIYNENFTCLSGQEAEVTYCEKTGDDQGSEPDKSSYNDQTHINFILKFPNALTHLFKYYESSLLQHYNSKQCVYFKYWFYDKIIKNILSDGNLHEFYEALEDEHEDLENQEASGSIQEAVREKLEEVFLEQDIEEEGEKLEDGSSIDSDEEDTEGSEYAQNGESQHKSKGDDNDSDKILLSLDKSHHCNIYKLKLNQIKDIKILYDYLEDKSNNRSSIEAISKSTYCSTFNKTIELYINKSKCKSNDFVNAYCREVEEWSKNDSLTNISILRCAEAESTSGTLEQVVENKELEGKRPQSFPSKLGAGSDSTTSSLYSDLLHTKTESFKEPPKPANCDSTTQLGCDAIGEKHTFVNDERAIESGHPHTPISSLRDMGRSYSKDSEASFLCPNVGVGRSCESSSQTLSEIPKETENHLKQLQENTNVHTEPDMDSQEDTGSTNTIVSSASTVLGVSALAFMLYKFTPLGSLINNRRGGMDTWDINEEGYDENLLFSSALGNTNANNNNYSIGYYSLGNT